jgi:hypothetical protein
VTPQKWESTATNGKGGHGQQTDDDDTDKRQAALA